MVASMSSISKPTLPLPARWSKSILDMLLKSGSMKLVETAGILRDRHLRSGLLFTADGSIRWIDL
jgi:hypothetical protein